MTLPMRTSLLCVVLIVAVAQCDGVAAVEPCRIRVVDKQNGWPVPLVELRTTHQVRFVTDNAGLIACDLPELMGRETWFDVRGHGYEVPADGFGSRGVRLKPEPGQVIEVRVERLSQALGVGLHGAFWKAVGVRRVVVRRGVVAAGAVGKGDQGSLA